jgi:predicted TIM-barrel fold metal-dependent hydrolase
VKRKEALLKRKDSVLRVDSHVHGNAARLNDPKQYVKNCFEIGVERVVLISRPEDGLFETAQKMGDFVIPVAWVDMDRIGCDGVHRLLDRGARGIKFIAPRHSYRDERYYPLYETVKERDSVAVFHTGYLMHDPEYSARWRTGMEDMRAAHIDTILRWVPHLKVLMAHFGNPYWEECWKVIGSHPTVYADLSGGTAIHRSMLFWRELFAPNGELGEAFLSKVCFGSDLSYFLDRTPIARHLAPYFRFYDRLLREVKAADALRRLIYRENVLRLFGFIEK